jgi:hypothetical protein
MIRAVAPSIEARAKPAIDPQKKRVNDGFSEEMSLARDGQCPHGETAISAVASPA